MKQRQGEQTDSKYILLLRLFHKVMYPIVLVFGIMVGWSLHKHYPSFEVFPFVVNTVEFLSAYSIESASGLGGGGILIYTIKKWIDKKMEKK